MNIVQGLIAAIAFLIGLPMNIYLLIIIIKYPSLHERSFFLSLQIIIAEIAYYVIVIPTILASSITGTWIFGEVVCNMTGMMHDAFAKIRFSMMTLDRFISVFEPFYYDRQGGKITVLLSPLMWFLMLVRITTPLYGILDCYNYIPTFKTCTIYSGCSGGCAILTGVGISYVCVILSLSLYMLIFIKVRKLFSQEESTLNNARKKNSIKTMFSLLLSLVGGTTPAIVLYILLFFMKPNTAVSIVNILVGRTCFNLIPVFDAIAFSRHGDIKAINSKLYSSLKNWIKTKVQRSG